MQKRIPITLTSCYLWASRPSHVRLLAERSREPLPSDLPSELIRWFQNVQRMLDRLAQAAERQNQLDAMVERLCGDQARGHRRNRDPAPGSCLCDPES
jgi:hypothetical protein